jgi:hypothetical protein
VESSYDFLHSVPNHINGVDNIKRILIRSKNVPLLCSTSYHSFNQNVIIMSLFFHNFKCRHALRAQSNIFCNVFHVYVTPEVTRSVN